MICTSHGTLYTVFIAIYIPLALYECFVRPSEGMLKVPAMQRAAPIAVLATGSLLILAFVPALVQGSLLQLLGTIAMLWIGHVMRKAQPYNPLRRMSILGLSGPESTDARR